MSNVINLKPAFDQIAESRRQLHAIEKEVMNLLSQMGDMKNALTYYTTMPGQEGDVARTCLLRCGEWKE